MKYILVLALFLTGCGATFPPQEERLKRIDEMTANEMRNVLRVCAMTDASWHDCYTSMFLYKDAPTQQAVK